MRLLHCEQRPIFGPANTRMSSQPIGPKRIPKRKPPKPELPFEFAIAAPTSPKIAHKISHSTLGRRLPVEDLAALLRRRLGQMDLDDARRGPRLHIAHEPRAAAVAEERAALVGLPGDLVLADPDADDKCAQPLA